MITASYNTFSDTANFSANSHSGFESVPFRLLDVLTFKAFFGGVGSF